MHWIHAKKAFEVDQPTFRVRITAVHDDGHFAIEGDDLELTLWHHDTEPVRLGLRCGGCAAWKPRFHVLDVVSVRALNVATVEPVAPCVPPARRRPTETTRQFIERATRENGGYTVPQRWLSDLDAIPDGDVGEPPSGLLVGTNNPTRDEQALLRKMAEEFGGPQPS